MKRLLALLILSCAPLPAPQAPPRQALCPAILPSADEVCEGLFTSGGYACLACASAQGCFDEADMVYCAQGGCSDPLCGRLQPGRLERQVDR